MQLSFTQKKHIRKNFGKLVEGLSIPNLIEVQKIKFDELIIFLDISDIPDEYYYNINFDNDIKINSFRDIIQEFLIKNFSSYLFFDIIFAKLSFFKENNSLRKKIAKNGQKKYFRYFNSKLISKFLKFG